MAAIIINVQCVEITSMTVTVKRPSESEEKSTKKARSITSFFNSTKVITKTTKTEPESESKVQTRTSSTSLLSIKEPTLVISEFKTRYVSKLTPEQRDLLQLELTTLDDSWFIELHEEFTKPYFLQLKRFLASQKKANVSVFPPENDIYSWSRLTPFDQVKVLVLGQDPYHNVHQAHGLAFSVKYPTKPPPSLQNIYKTIKIDYPDFKISKEKGDLTSWAQQGVLMLNACLTVKAHEANSHAKKGWEQFTECIIRKILTKNENNIVILLWGSPAQKRVENLKLKLNKDNLLVLKAVHPSPLSARRGFFDSKHFKKTNEWLINKKEKPIDWSIS